jgi:hypothetical protein
MERRWRQRKNAWIRNTRSTTGAADALGATTRATWCLYVAYEVFDVAASIGFAWPSVAIVRGKTLYARWVVLADPLMCMLAGVLIDRALPQPFKLLLTGAGLSVWMRSFFVHGLPATTCRIVQPYGRDVTLQSTLISVHPTTVHAFAEIDRLAEQMGATGARSDAVKPIVIDAGGRRVERPNRH